MGVAPIPKSTDAQRIKENIDIFDFELNENEVALLDTFNTGTIALPLELQSDNFGHKYFPFDIEF